VTVELCFEAKRQDIFGLFTLWYVGIMLYKMYYYCRFEDALYY